MSQVLARGSSDAPEGAGAVRVEEAALKPLSPHVPAVHQVEHRSEELLGWL